MPATPRVVGLLTCTITQPAACQGSTCSGSVPVCSPAAMVSARLPAASGHSLLPTRSQEHRLFQSPAAPLRNPTTKHRPGLGHMGEPSSKPHPSQQHLGCIRKLAMGGDPSLHPGSCLILGSSVQMWTYQSPAKGCSGCWGTGAFFV